jgi:hypothetical protein
MGMEPKGRWAIEYLPELLRIPLLGTSVNERRNRRRLAASQFAPTANKHLYFVDERQQLLKRWVEPLPAPPAEAGFGRFVGLGREPVPRRPPSRIHGVRATRHHEVGSKLSSCSPISARVQAATSTSGWSPLMALSSASL